MGSVPEGEPLEALLRLSDIEMERIRPEIKPTLFPSEFYVDEMVVSRMKSKDSDPLPMGIIYVYTKVFGRRRLTLLDFTR